MAQQWTHTSHKVLLKREREEKNLKKVFEDVEWWQRCDVLWKIVLVILIYLWLNVLSYFSYVDSLLSRN